MPVTPWEMCLAPTAKDHEMETKIQNKERAAARSFSYYRTLMSNREIKESMTPKMHLPLIFSRKRVADMSRERVREPPWVRG